MSVLKRSALVCLSLGFALSLTVSAQKRDHSTWSDYGGAPDGAQYSSLRQINRSNVTKLERAWSFNTGDERPYLFNPLIVGRTMYVLAHNNSVTALDAVTGREAWTHAFTGKRALITTRGLNYWQSSDGRDRRLILAVDNALQELNAMTGEAIASFGHEGRIDLREGLGRDPEKLALVQSYNPGKVYKDLIILGSVTNEEYASGPGDVRAFNVQTGELAWTFHTIPHPGEVGYDTWPKDAWKTVGGANAWSGMALDERRGTIYIPTSSPKYNFYGANRTGADLFGDSLLALDAATGKLKWYYQMVHHDIWDYDNATTPMLLTVKHNGRPVDVVTQASKTGFLWVFNRDTGKPLWTVEERAVPASDMPGEHTWPTQPFPSAPPPFARQRFTADDLSPYMDADEREAVRKQMLAARNRGLFEPPSKEDTVEMPGNNGGANFGGAAADPAHGYVYVISKDLPAMLKLTLGADSQGVTDPAKLHYRSSFGFMFAKSGLPMIAPPWTTFTAYDLNTGTIRWQEPLGDVPELAEQGHPGTGTQFPKVNPVVTAGGLIFTGSRDRVIRALDADTGKVLWHTETGMALEGMPAVYQVDGREYVVFCAAARASSHTHAVPGHPADKSAVQGEYVAYALPR